MPEKPDCTIYTQVNDALDVCITGVGLSVNGDDVWIVQVHHCETDRTIKLQMDEVSMSRIIESYKRLRQRTQANNN